MLVPKPPGPLLRLGRYVLWPFPDLYWRVARFVRTEPLPSWDFDLWVGGYPRSGNTFFWKLLERAFRDKRVLGHLHVPPAIIRAIRSGRPGAMVIRNPRDAALSWSIFTGLPMRHCIEYYIDFHRILWPYRSQILLLEFAELTADVARAVGQFERRFALPPTFFETRAELLEDVNKQIDAMFLRDDRVNEMQVARPSEARRGIKQRLNEELDRSPALRAKLRVAERLYRAYADLLQPCPDPAAGSKQSTARH